MKRLPAIMTLGILAATVALVAVAADNVGNPRPGYPHDTIVIHVMSDQSGPKACDGGHSLFLRH